VATKVNTELRGLRAKAQLYDELVEQLAASERELDRVRRSATRNGVDPAWREIANALAEALRPYSLFREQRVEDGRIVVETRVPGATLRKARKAREALDRLGPTGRGRVLPRGRHPRARGRVATRGGVIGRWRVGAPLRTR